MSLQTLKTERKILLLTVLRPGMGRWKYSAYNIIRITIVAGLLLSFLYHGCNKEGIATSYDIEPKWSPDGKYIAFFRGSNLIYLPGQEDTVTGIKILDLTTYDVTNLAVGGAPDWAPDGNKIVYAAGKITIIDIATKETTMLTEGGSPDWSSDGSRILFVRGAGTDSSSIFMMDTSGFNIKPLFTAAWDPDWHPAGDRLIFSANVSVMGIYLGDTNGNVIRPIRLSNDSLIPAFGRFSPDGARIVYADINNSEGGNNCYVHVMDTLGDNDIILTEGVFPSWSPDGRKIVFARYSDEEEVTVLWIMNRDGSGQIRITDPE